MTLGNLKLETYICNIVGSLDFANGSMLSICPETSFAQC
jgi:hypothetical protein